MNMLQSTLKCINLLWNGFIACTGRRCTCDPSHFWSLWYATRDRVTNSFFFFIFRNDKVVQYSLCFSIGTTEVLFFPCLLTPGNRRSLCPYWWWSNIIKARLGISIRGNAKYSYFLVKEKRKSQHSHFPGPAVKNFQSRRFIHWNQISLLVCWIRTFSIVLNSCLIEWANVEQAKLSDFGLWWLCVYDNDLIQCNHWKLNPLPFCEHSSGPQNEMLQDQLNWLASILPYTEYSDTQQSYKQVVNLFTWPFALNLHIVVSRFFTIFSQCIKHP